MIADWNLFFPSGTRVLALPDWQRPRLYLPEQNFLQCWRESSFYPAYRSRARLYRFLLRIRATTGLVAVRTAQPSGWPLGEFCQEALPHISSAVVLVGTSGPAQKITVQLRDGKGRILGYLKYAEKEAARKRLRQEHQMLFNIPGARGPEPLKYGPLANGEALLTTSMSGRKLPANLPPASDLTGFLMSLAVLPPVPVEDHPWVLRIRERNKFEFDSWFETLAGKNWPVVVQHGDFAPWNLLRRPDGTIGAIDWEYGALESFPYLDLAYYVLQTSALIYRRAPSKAADHAAAYLSLQPQLALSRVEARSLTYLAAYDAYEKSLEDGHAPGDSLQTWRRAVWESKA